MLEIEIQNLNHDEYIQITSYIEDAGKIHWGDKETPIYKLRSIENFVKGNPPRYYSFKIKVTRGELLRRPEDREKVKESLKGLMDLLFKSN